MKKLLCTLFFIFCFCTAVQARELPTEQNISPNKIWTLVFTGPFDKNTLNEISVVDDYGNNIEIERKIINDKTVTIEPTDGAWGRGINYTMKIGDIKSSKGKIIKEHSTKKFVTGGTDFTPSGPYQDDEKYLYENMSKMAWHDGSVARLSKTYDIDIFKKDNVINVFFNIDTWSTQNLMNSPNANEVLKMQIEKAWDYTKSKYPNENINVGVYFNELLNYKVAGYDDTQIQYDKDTGKYRVVFLLAAIYPDGKEYILNGGGK